MTFDQIFLLCVLGAVLGLFIWGRLRHDIVAMLALLATAVGGQIQPQDVFSGFASAATVTVALVLVASRGLVNSGAVNMIARNVLPPVESTTVHVGLLSGVAGALSGFMNNVGALALLMPAALQSAKQAKRPASLLLMPLAFGSILGGLVTLIGTPPNIIIAAIRGETSGHPFTMFDFAPVGGAIAVAGIVFVALVGWRLIPSGRAETPSSDELMNIGDYVTEARIPEDHALIGSRLRALDELMSEQDATVLGVLRGTRRLDPATRTVLIRSGDILLIRAGSDAINAALSTLDLRPPAPPSNAEDESGGTDGTHSTAAPAETAPETAAETAAETTDGDRDKRLFGGPDVAIAEAVVKPNASIVGRNLASLALRRRYGVNLLAVARQGRSLHEELRLLRFEPGDVLLLEGDSEHLPLAISRLDCLPLAARPIQGSRFHLAWLAIALFGAAILAATLGLTSFTIALAITVVAMVLTNIVPVRGLYDDIDWSIIVLLGAMIPVGQAMQATGTTAVIAEALSSLVGGYPAVVALVVVLVLTMTLSDVINNAATAVVMAPIAIDLAGRLNASADTFLMAVAIGASCAFLTPIGHQNNALIMGPGGYRFGDYWRMGLPLEILIVAVAIPMLLWIWPLT
jgi:di/tricarboxylate transporter